MAEVTRRELLEGTGAIALAGLVSSTSTNALADGNEGLYGGHTPKPLPFKSGKLKGLSEKLITSHWENNYGGAVKALNAVEGKLLTVLKDKETSPSLFAAYKREQLIRQGSVVLHERYFGNLGGDGKPAAEIKEALDKGFGGYAVWESEFRKTAMGLAGGSGWTVLSYNLHLNRLENYWSWDHMHNAVCGIPLLVLDMYEHAFHIDYGAQAAKYVDAFMENVNWAEVNHRYTIVKKTAYA